MIRKYILPLLFCAFAASAQEVFVTKIEGDVMTADVENAQGKTIADVLTRRFYMPTGESTILSDYTVNGYDITAKIDKITGDYFYRIEVTFDDGTTIFSDCFNADMSLNAFWLSDLTPSNASGNPVHNDVCANGQPIQIDRVTFGKGVSLLATSWVEYQLPRTMQYVQFTMGMQDYRADGSDSSGYARIITSVNGAETGWKGNMQAYSRAGRGNTVCKFVARHPNNGNMAINTFRFTANDCNSDLTDDYANLGAVRFYSSEKIKRSQVVEFENEGGFIPDNVESIELKAASSRNQEIIYRIVQGEDLATLEGNVLTPTDGKRGTVTVEAVAADNDNFTPASAQISFTFNRAPTVQYLATYPIDETSQTVYLYVDPKEKSIEQLQLEIFSTPRGLISLGRQNLDGKNATGVANIYAVTTPRGSVHQLQYQFGGEGFVIEPYGEGLNSFKYMSDMEGNTVVTGWGQATVNAPYSGSVGSQIENTKYSYSKGYGIHAANNETGAYVLAPAANLSEFDRFVVDVGGQVITNTARGKLSFYLYENNVLLASTGNLAWGEVSEWDIPITGKLPVKLVVGRGGDNNQNDVAAIGAPRFYYISSAKKPQSVMWPKSEVIVDYYKPFSIELNATSTSGLPVFYRIAEGAEYAEIVNGNTLQFNKIVTGGDVVVEAVQPGDKVYGPAEAAQCRFVVTDRLIVKRDERVQIDGDQDVDELIVYADAHSSGQVVVSGGVANVKKLIIKYTFVPGEWNYISFPSSVNLDEISDLNEKGYRRGEGYQLMGYNSRVRSHTPSLTPWEEMASADVTAKVGYALRLDPSLGTEPQEITFVITNVSLDLDSGIGDLHLTLDMSHSEPGSVQSVYVKPANVKGNILKVNVRFRPDDESLLPVNHANALETMRVTFTADRKGLRFTLPDQTPARVALFSEDGTQMVKAVRYVAPMVMDISDVPSGSYQLVINYGPASTTRTLNL